MRRHPPTTAILAILLLFTGTAGLAQDDYRAQAFAAERAGELDRAAELFMKLFHAGADDQEVLSAGARCLEKTGRYNDALDVASRGKKRFPEVATFRVSLARLFNLKAAGLLASTGKMDSHVVFNFQDAIREAEDLLKKWPANRDARLILANSHYTLGEWDKAKVQGQELVKRFPSHPGGHIIMGDLAFEHYKLLRRRAGEAGEADEATAKETAQKIAGAHEAARRSYQKAIDLDHKRVAAQRKLGDVYAWNGEVEKALARYGKALVLDPNTRVSHTWIANNTEPGKRMSFYEKLYKRYVARPGAKKSVGAIFVWYVAAALTADKQYEKAETLYEQVVSLNPSYQSGYYYAMYSAYFYRDDEDAAMRFGALYAARAPIEFADLVRAIPAEHRDGVVQLVKFLAKRAMDKRRLAASRELNHVLAAIVDTADAWNNYAFMARDSGKFDESEKAYRHALEIEPESGQLMNDLAVILHYHKRTPKDLAEAEQLYKDAIKYARKTLADAKASAKDKAVARQTVQDATGNMRRLPRR